MMPPYWRIRRCRVGLRAGADIELSCGGGHDGLRVEVGLGEGGALCAFVHDDDAVGKAGEFGQFGGDEQDGGAFGGELADDAVDFVFRATSTPRVGSSRMRTCG